MLLSCTELCGSLQRDDISCSTGEVIVSSKADGISRFHVHELKIIKDVFINRFKKKG
jgi:hypothetical protein